MKFIIGLGNPGPEYKNSRHNAGFLVLDELLSKIGALSSLNYQKKFKAEVAKVDDLVFVKPMDFMNNSGQVTRSVINFYTKNFSLDDIYVIHDDLDVELGQFKIMQGKGPKIHNGLLDLYTHLGGKGFWHVRVGVDNRGGDRSIPGHDYVLQPFPSAEAEVFGQIKDQLATELKEVIES